jgi:hypothetical protein
MMKIRVSLISVEPIKTPGTFVREITGWTQHGWEVVLELGPTASLAMAPKKLL